MEEYVVYVLKALNYPNKYYVGYTSSLLNRIKSHNYFAKKGYTTRYRPWEVVYIQFFTEKSEALKHEKFLKSGKGKQWRKDNIEL